MLSMQSVIRRSRVATAHKFAQSTIPRTARAATNSTPRSTSSTYATTAAPKPASLTQLSESFADGTSAAYVEGMYEAWKQNPSSVHKSWDTYFKNIEQGLAPGQAFTAPPTLRPGQISQMTAPLPSAAGNYNVTDSMKVLLLIRAYQVRGHTLANLDPLGIYQPKIYPELLPETYGFTEQDLDREILIGESVVSGFLSAGSNRRTLRQILTRLRETYCGTIGIEYMHIQDRVQCDWIRERFETPVQYSFTKEEKHLILDRLSWSDSFERFLSIKYPTEKRFGLDGCEALIPGMKAMIDRAADLGVENIVMGMPHRGRLNVLCNVVRKPLEAVFSEFNKSMAKIPAKMEAYGSGDVKYHLGTSYDRPTRNGKRVHLSLVANPSHLEAVDPVVEGKTRAKQYYEKDHNHEKCMSIILHGDAAFAGQGVVYETLDLSGQPNYTTGGTIHIIVNNQIGFTTDPKRIRDTPYCTGVAKSFGAPIFHVNGDDPEAVVHVCKLAAEWRQRFHRDVVVDIVCYRRYGHNEIDNPSYTQPVMYQKIAKHPPTLKIYSEKLIKEGVITETEFKAMIEGQEKTYGEAFEKSKDYVPAPGEWLSSKWAGFKSPETIAKIKDTGVPRDTLYKIGKAISTLPEGFNAHPMIKKIMTARGQAIESGQKIDWATGEALAIGSLLLEGNHVRLSGQDVERGTFSHRHAAIFDQKTNESYVALNHISPEQEKFVVTNSSLSEFAVLGFELGYSLENPSALVMWEAQFGDFANGAQVIIDQFITSGERKWMRQTGLVMLLPHGYEGQGPEHSSARLERFLQMSDEDPSVIPDLDETRTKQIQECNIQVVNITTPANYFHALRRQIHREFRKPLIVMSPKSLLKHPLAVSNIEDFDDSQEHLRFQQVIPEVEKHDGDKTVTATHRIAAEHRHKVHTLVPRDQIRKLIFCSGKVYYDLWKERDARGIRDIAIVRIEQIAPFPFNQVIEQIQSYPNAQVVWCQEEPQNMGAWNFVHHRLVTCMKKILADNAALPQNQQKKLAIANQGLTPVPSYVGRKPSAATAAGSPDLHILQLNQFLNEAFA